MNFTIHKLFPTPVYHSTIPPLDPITLHKLMNNEWVAPGYLGANRTHKESADRKILHNPGLANLKKIIQKHIDFYVFEVLGVGQGLSWEISTSWVNQNSKGDFHDSHYHTNSMVSGVLYLRVPDETSSIFFHRDKGHENLWSTLLIEFEKDNEYNAPSIGLCPNDFDILIFPSILAHSVTTNMNDIDRFSLAFNVWPRGTIGEGGNCELSL